ncbi:VWA domain-containing protein [Umezawaea endophytica]|uniref:VWA domain-containing protein n=1 Tax=Umezawaea endophytica TaxID=1654476 RepID=A0A9X3AFM6_9PSEU|nr:VWA domain-containing protein [Umezawaea endophytica]MCS7478516.1 VWA domain-containing protein [Umezawaea endophytica]
MSRFTDLLARAGLPLGPDRAARFATAITVLTPTTLADLRRCALITLTSDPTHVSIVDSVFTTVFDDLADPAEERGQRGTPNNPATPRATSPTSALPDATPGAAGTTMEFAASASATERLSNRDFADLTPAELATLVVAMHRFALRTPPRRTRRHHTARRGTRTDLRRTLSQARRTAGEPVHLMRSTRRDRPRKLVVLCDISGSMAPYARAMLQLLYCATGGARAEVFTFATRLTRLTRALTHPTPSAALARAGRTAPDWSGGTRIAAALAALDHNVTRGAVVLIISDGWETGDPTELATQMAQLSRLAHRVVWANPRTARPSYRPLAGGMAAAWPYCDAIVSAHNLDALDDLIDALAGRRSLRGADRQTSQFGSRQVAGDHPLHPPVAGRAGGSSPAP